MYKHIESSFNDLVVLKEFYDAGEVEEAEVDAQYELIIERLEENEFKSTLLKKGASIGANATIICGVTIGAYALIGAGTVITKDVPDFALITGNPGKQTGWVSRAGHKLMFDDAGMAACPETGESYFLKSGIVLLKK